MRFEAAERKTVNHPLTSFVTYIGVDLSNNIMPVIGNPGQPSGSSFPTSGKIYEDLKAYVKVRVDLGKAVPQPKFIRDGNDDGHGFPPHECASYEVNSFRRALLKIKQDLGVPTDANQGKSGRPNVVSLPRGLSKFIMLILFKNSKLCASPFICLSPIQHCR